VHWQKQGRRKCNQLHIANQQQLSAGRYLYNFRFTNEHFIFNQHLHRQTNKNPLPANASPLAVINCSLSFSYKIKNSQMNKRELIKKYWLYLLILLVGLIFLVKPIIMTVENYRLAKSGQVTNAVIVNKEWESSSYRNDNGYFYTFTINGVLYTGHTFDKDKGPLDTLKIIYLTDRPNVNRPYEFIDRNYLK
jgi:hypothetical protein